MKSLHKIFEESANISSDYSKRELFVRPVRKNEPIAYNLSYALLGKMESICSELICSIEVLESEIDHLARIELHEVDKI